MGGIGSRNKLQKNY